MNYNKRLCQVMEHQDYPISHICLDPNKGNLLMCYKCCEQFKIKAEKIEDVYKQYCYKFENFESLKMMTLKLVKDTISKLYEQLSRPFPELELRQFNSFDDFQNYVYTEDKQKLKLKLKEVYSLKELSDQELKDKSISYVSEQIRKFNNSIKPEEVQLQKSLLDTKDIDQMMDYFQHYFEIDEFQYLVDKMQSFNYTQQFESQGIGLKRFIEDDTYIFYGKVTNKNIKNGMGFQYDKKYKSFKGGIWKYDQFIFGAHYKDYILKLGDLSDNMRLNGKGAIHYYLLQNTFQGNFIQDKLDGNKCEVINVGSGYLYEGAFQNNLFHGHGVLSEEGSIYTGQFVEGKKNGWGILRDMKNDIVYEGQFQNDQIHGFCTKINNQECQYGVYWNGIENFVQYVSLDQNTPVYEIRIYQMGQLTQTLANSENVAFLRDDQQEFQEQEFQEQEVQQGFPQYENQQRAIQFNPKYQ